MLVQNVNWKNYKFAEVINEALEDIDPSIRVISEPGQYYVTSAFKAAAFVHGKKIILENGRKKYMYYINDGVNGSFWDELVMMKARLPKILNKTDSDTEEKFLSTLWGPTCDSYDCIAKDVFLPELKIGNWLYWEDMGAYTTCLSTKFNGFPGPVVFPFMRRSNWKAFCAELLNIRNNQVVHTHIDKYENFECDDNGNNRYS